MTIYDELIKRHELPRAYEDWSAYREKWTQFLLQGLPKETDTLLIVGAGACSDYDLAALLKRVHTLYLLDIDRAMLEQALRRLDTSERARVILQETDLLGIRPDAYRTFCRCLQEFVNRRGRLTDIRELASYALPLVDELYRQAADSRTRLKLPEVSYVAVSGVHSQINHILPWIWEAYMQALGQREQTVFDRISRENDSLQRECNDRLFDASGQGIFFASETGRLGVPGQIQGSYQALADIDRRIRCNSCRCLAEEKMAWPYDLRQQIIYEMRCLFLKN